jgi:hypothetical protein
VCPNRRYTMDEEEQLAAINQAATAVKSRLSESIGNKIYFARAKTHSNITKAVLQSIDIANFRLTDREEGIIDRKINISLQLEKAIDNSFVFCCHFWSDLGAINVILKYAPIEQAPEDGVNAYEPSGIWYTRAFLALLSRNPYVTELHQGLEDRSSFSFYSEPDEGCDVAKTAEFIISIVKNLPGFEELSCPDKTMREQIIMARVGQGDYRKRLEGKWNNKCSVLGIEVRD